MKYDEIKLGQTVIDGEKKGMVKKKLKTVVHILFDDSNEVVKYDKAHLQFLTLVVDAPVETYLEIDKLTTEQLTIINSFNLGVRLFHGSDFNILLRTADGELETVSEYYHGLTKAVQYDFENFVKTHDLKRLSLTDKTIEPGDKFYMVDIKRVVRCTYQGPLITNGNYHVVVDDLGQPFRLFNEELNKILAYDLTTVREAYLKQKEIIEIMSKDIDDLLKQNFIK